MTRDKKLIIVDLFCGAGGMSTAAIRAAKHVNRENPYDTINYSD